MLAKTAPLMLAAIALSSCLSTDTALEKLVKDTAGKTARIVRPASTASVVGREIIDGRPANSILRTESLDGASLINPYASWTSRSMVYSNKGTFDVDFGHYVDTSALSKANFSGNAEVSDLAVEALLDPIPDVQGARLRELVRADGTCVIDVYQGQLRAATVAFDGNWIAGWGTTVNPATQLSDELSVSLDASGRVKLSGKGAGTRLVIGSIPARVEVSRSTYSRERAGSRTQFAGYQLSLSEESALEYLIRIASFGIPGTELRGRFNEGLTIQQGSGRSVILVVERHNLGSYNYTIQEFTATWVD